jgi:hypothetical protein
VPASYAARTDTVRCGLELVVLVFPAQELRDAEQEDRSDGRDEDRTADAEQLPLPHRIFSPASRNVPSDKIEGTHGPSRVVEPVRDDLIDRET